MNNEILENWKKLGEYAALLPCPRCGSTKMERKLWHNALSRRTDVYICPSCGTEEALEDYTGKKKSIDEWFLFSELFASDVAVKELPPKGLRLNVSKQVVLTQEDVDDIMCSALEGGICYWCNKAEVVESEYYGEYASEQISRGGSLRLYDSEEDEVYILTLSKLVNGIKLACRNGFGNDWFDGDKFECGYIDGEAADVIVQYALFGELVYG